ncbi:unnamed protein product [Lactuca virosa]|uniref:Uncharacterized protein n=1 Tax=Lactuca virosa TaxID=75947 RepID=A0AAU9M8M3_9ASTR|nr:unnamed protein product [Lactuca virosa]
MTEIEPKGTPVKRVLTNVKSNMSVNLSLEQLKEIEAMLLLCSSNVVSSKAKGNNETTWEWKTPLNEDIGREGMTMQSVSRGLEVAVGNLQVYFNELENNCYLDLILHIRKENCQPWQSVQKSYLSTNPRQFYLQRSEMASQKTMTDAQAALGQQQLHRDAATNQQSAQNAGIVEQTGDSVKRMTQGAADIAGGAASGVLGLAQGAAMGAANVAEGAAGAVKNTFGNNPGSQNTTSQQHCQNAGIVDQTNDSVKRIANGATGVVGGATSGVLGLAQGVAMGAANVAEGAAGAVKNTFGNNSSSQDCNAKP